MRPIEVEDGLRLRFPGRNEDFDQGVEAGIAAVLMTVIGGEFTRPVATDNLEQLRTLAERLGYHILIGNSGAELTDVIFKTGRSRPKLTLVHSAAARALPAPAAPAGPGKSTHRSAPTLVRRIEEAAVS